MACEEGDLVGSVDQGTSGSRFLVCMGKETSASVADIFQQDCQAGSMSSDRNQADISERRCSGSLTGRVLRFFSQQRWVEEDPMNILESVEICIDKAVKNLEEMNIDPKRIKCCGITNQRETTIVWDKLTGKPLYNAVGEHTRSNMPPVRHYFKDLLEDRSQKHFETFDTCTNVPSFEWLKRGIENGNLWGSCDVWSSKSDETIFPSLPMPLHDMMIWLDARTSTTVNQLIEKTPDKSKDHLRPVCGLPITTYFSAVKLRWIIDNVDEVKKAIDEDRCLFGTVDTWLLWNMTGGVSGGVHVTDVTNASRTMLMNLHTLQWDDDLCSFFDIPKSILPEIRSSSEIYGKMCSGALKGLAISGILGDQQAALVGQCAFKVGQAKNTYGTGCFLLYNTGTKPVQSKSGLLTTVGYKLGKTQPVVYALEGAIAIGGAVVRWLRDNLGIIETSADIENLAAKVESTHGVYFVPAFSGLFAPYWQSDARGVLVGLTQYTKKEHIARSALEAVCFQTKELLEAMEKDSGIKLDTLQVDGGMTVNNLLMQIQADILGIDVVRPSMPETTALGAAMAAGAAEGVDVWNLEQENLSSTERFTSKVNEEDRSKRFARWKKAVERSFHWAVPGEEDDN